MIWFFAWIFRWPLVWLEDLDKTISLRRVHYHGGIRFAKRYPYGIRTVFILPEGKIDHGCYVMRWLPANSLATKMFEETK